MPSYPTPDQVTALAPDASSVKSGRELSSPRKWTLLGADADVLWGLAQGSGKDSYQTRVLPDGSSTKCSCPSRKFPCKHALGLLYIAAETPASLVAKDRPEWVAEWLSSRAERVDKAKELAVQKAEAKPVDGAAQAKRHEKRAGRVEEGVTTLSQWLSDVVRRGFTETVATHNFEEDMARRMVDAQAPALARRLRFAGEAARSGPGWEARLMDHLGRLHLLLSAFGRRDSLPPDMRAEVEQLIGWTVPQETVLQSAPVTDTWLVAARTVTEEDRLITTTTWLLGLNSRRWAQLLRTSPVTQHVADPFPLGRTIRAEACFYPGIRPLRILWKGEPTSTESPAAPPTETVTDLLQRSAHILAENPWRNRLPALLKARPGKHAGRPVLVDEAGAALPLSASADTIALLSSLCGGHPKPVSGLWDGERFQPLSVFEGTEATPLTPQTAT